MRETYDAIFWLVQGLAGWLKSPVEFEVVGVLMEFQKLAEQSDKAVGDGTGRFTEEVKSGAANKAQVG